MSIILATKWEWWWLLVPYFWLVYWTSAWSIHFYLRTKYLVPYYYHSTSKWLGDAPDRLAYWLNRFPYDTWPEIYRKYFYSHYLNAVSFYWFFRVDFYHLLLQTIPCNFTLYTKKQAFFFFFDFFIITFFLRNCKQRGSSYRYKPTSWILPPYLLLKGITLILPFIWMTPEQRFPFWILTFILLAAEITLGIWILWGYLFGYNWPVNSPTKYKRATYNRVEFWNYSHYAYFFYKIGAVFNYRGYDIKPMEIRFDDNLYLDQQYRALPNLHMPTFSSVVPDTSYLTSFMEMDEMSNLRYGLLFLLALSSLSVYSIILAGWSSNSKYAFLGALRSAAQMISYEITISLILLPVVLLAGSMNITKIVFAQTFTIWYLFPLLPCALIFLVAMLAETNRTPFDLAEAEAELVAGYNVDYSSLPFALFFLGEYSNMMLMAILFCCLFLGGWYVFTLSSVLFLALKAVIIFIFFILVRATLPRYRYDQLMTIGWKVFLPFLGGFLLFLIGIIDYFDVAPIVSETAISTAPCTKANPPISLSSPNK